MCRMDSQSGFEDGLTVRDSHMADDVELKVFTIDPVTFIRIVFTAIAENLFLTETDMGGQGEIKAQSAGNGDAPLEA